MSELELKFKFRSKSSSPEREGPDSTTSVSSPTTTPSASIPPTPSAGFVSVQPVLSEDPERFTAPPLEAAPSTGNTPTETLKRPVYTEPADGTEAEASTAPASASDILSSSSETGLLADGRESSPSPVGLETLQVPPGRASESNDSVVSGGNGGDKSNVSSEDIFPFSPQSSSTDLLTIHKGLGTPDLLSPTGNSTSQGPTPFLPLTLPPGPPLTTALPPVSPRITITPPPMDDKVGLKGIAPVESKDSSPAELKDISPAKAQDTPPIEAPGTAPEGPATPSKFHPTVGPATPKDTAPPLTVAPEGITVTPPGPAAPAVATPPIFSPTTAKAAPEGIAVPKLSPPSLEASPSLPKDIMASEPTTNPKVPPKAPPTTHQHSQQITSMSYLVAVYYLPFLGMAEHNTRRVNLQVKLTPQNWSFNLTLPFTRSRREHTVYTIPRRMLKVKPHPLCSCGRAHREQQLHDARKEKQKKKKEAVPASTAATRKSRSGSVVSDTASVSTAAATAAAVMAEDKEWDSLASCTATCRLRRGMGTVSNPWRSGAIDGEINVEYWLYVAHPEDDLDEIDRLLLGNEESDEDEVPLLSRKGWMETQTGLPPLWKRSMVVVRMEDRMPVDVNPVDEEDRQWGEELRVIERWLKNRCRVTGSEEGWEERFVVEQLEAVKGGSA